MKLETSIQFVKGVGPKLAKKLEKLDITTVKSCFYCLPRQFEDRRQLPKISQLKQNTIQQCLVTLNHFQEKNVNNKVSIIEGVVSDGSGSMGCVWFNQGYLKRLLKPGLTLLIKGKVDINTYTRSLQCTVSDFEILRDSQAVQQAIGKVFPIYPLTAGVFQSQIRQVLLAVFKSCSHHIKDPLPYEMLHQLKIMSLQEALTQIHFPNSIDHFQKARYRLVFDEFFYYQLSIAEKRQYIKQTATSQPLISTGELCHNYLKQLPYTLTNAQKKVFKEIKQDITTSKSMNRLVQGDVGSGKTDVAILSLLSAVESNKTGVLMAPTEILATQHYLKLKKLLEPLNVTVFLLKSKMKASQKKQVVTAIKNETNCIVVGTHALIEKPIEIPSVGIVIIDEQHKFGVMQRLFLQQKGVTPHSLFMTATPIPRTFMLTCFGDLDKSVIDELPPGRIPPQTFFIKEHNKKRIYDQCKQMIQNKQQIYVVYPLVEESEKCDLQSAIEGWEELKKVFSNDNVGLIHGRLDADEKAAVMELFKQNKIQVLVATTVIEVGVDVPNATGIIIQDAERFGLSQLHQLRGRVGRGKKESFCFLIGNPKSENSRKRIHAMLDTSDGFKLAEYDLLIRGPGDMLGTKQSGLPSFKIADLILDNNVLQLARSVAFKLLASDPQLSEKKHHDIRDVLRQQHTPFKEVQLN